MTNRISLRDLQVSVRDTTSFNNLDDYLSICKTYLLYLDQNKPTRIVSPTASNYVFYQYDQEYSHRITRPLNSHLFLASFDEFEQASARFHEFLADLKLYQEKASDQPGRKSYIETGEINQVVYTIQQAIGAIGDSFDNPNQSRKRIGQLFEQLVRLIILTVGVACEPRTINIPIPGFQEYKMAYELDFVFSRTKANLTTEATYIHETEIVGSVKTTSKDRIDKFFLDKFLLSRLLSRAIPVVAIFLHDVQRASTQGGQSIFGINSTFKSNHFLGYTVALNKLDGVYYVDPRPDMLTSHLLREQIRDFQRFLVSDLWTLPHISNKTPSISSVD